MVNLSSISKVICIFTYPIILLLLFPILISANWGFCELPDYINCVENNFTYQDEIIHSKIAWTMIDDRGLTYEQFAPSSFAVGNVYVHIYYEGDELWYLYNLTDWSNETIDKYTTLGGPGILLDGSGYYKLASLLDEYVGCPVFVALAYSNQTWFDENNTEWITYGWAGAGYLKPKNNTCSHIRVVECLANIDCPDDEYCKRSDNLTWRAWSCQPIPDDMKVDKTPVVKNSFMGTNYLSGAGGGSGYTPTYEKSDIRNIFIDLVATPLVSFIQWIDLLALAIIIGVIGIFILRFKQ